MSEIEFAGIKLPPVEQIGIVVHDLDRAMAYYTSTFGWGPFEVHIADLRGCCIAGNPVTAS